MISDAIALFDFIKKNALSQTISALFNWEGKKISGSDNIKIDVYKTETGTRYYNVKPHKDYVFLRIPVNVGAVIEDLGMENGDKNAYANYFRYISNPDGCIYGGPRANVKANFMVIGYLPTELLDIKEK